MHSFKKTFISTLTFLLCAAFFSLILIEPYFHSEYHYYNDTKLRESMAGKIDCLILGASHALDGFVPNVVDDILGCNCYNLSGSQLTWPGREALLKEEISRNPVKTVILEISYDTLCHDPYYTEGNIYLIPRLKTASERFIFTCKNVHMKDWHKVYADFLNSGFHYLFNSVFTNKNVNNVIYENKGFFQREATDISLSGNEIADSRNSDHLSDNYNKKNINTLYRIVSCCKENNIELIYVVTPVSDKIIWELSNLSIFFQFLSDLSKETDCKLFDFNLIKERYSVFSDKTSFYDSVHLSESGAIEFSKLFAETLKNEKSGIGNDDNFYHSYAEMITDSPYFLY